MTEKVSYIHYLKQSITKKDTLNDRLKASIERKDARLKGVQKVMKNKSENESQLNDLRLNELDYQLGVGKVLLRFGRIYSILDLKDSSLLVKLVL